MVDYLYGVRIPYGGQLEVQKTKIVKETPKTIKVEKGISSYGYRNNIPKNFPSLAHSEDEAIRIFISNLQSKVEILYGKIDEMANDIYEAEKLL